MSGRTKAELELENEELREAIEAVYDRVSGVLADDEEDGEDDEGEEDEDL